MIKIIISVTILVYNVRNAIIGTHSQVLLAKQLMFPSSSSLHISPTGLTVQSKQQS